MFDGMYLTTKRTSSGVPYDVFKLEPGGRLYAPTVPDWELHRESQERRSVLRREPPQPVQ